MLSKLVHIAGGRMTKLFTTSLETEGVDAASNIPKKRRAENVRERESGVLKMIEKRRCLVCGCRNSGLRTIEPNGICSICNNVHTEWREKKVQPK